MANVDDPAIREAISDVRDDSTETNWVALGYKSKTAIKVVATGTSGHAGLMELCTDDALFFCLVRMIDGDQESRRVKFIGLTFVGEDVGGMQRGRVATHKGSVYRLCGQMNVEIQADNHSECSVELLTKKLKIAGGADYDTGSNAGGYRSDAKSIRQKSLAAYQQKEKFGNIEAVVYTTSALPSSTPMDLSGRPTVASASEAQKNTMDNVLDGDKHQGKAGVYKGNATGPAGGIFKTNKSGGKVAEKPADTTDADVEARKRSAQILAEVMAEQEAEEAAAKAAAEAESAAAQEAEPEPEAAAEPEESGGDDLSDDPEERARQRAEKRKARREAAAAKAREDVSAFKEAIAAEDTAAEPEAPKAKPAPPAKKPSLTDITVAKDEKKKGSLFDDDEDEEDDLFAKPAVKAAAAPAPAADEEEDLPPGPEPSTEDFSGSDVTLPYDALRKFLVAQELITSEFSGSPEELAQLVIDEAAHM